MSDDFIPLNQSTPVQGRWQQGRNQQQRFQNNRQHGGGGQRRGGHHNYHNRWGNSPRSFSSNSSNNSFGQDKHNIDAYLHPSMLQDPWASLRQKNEPSQSST